MIMLLSNALGAVIYVVLASNSWTIPQEHEHGLHVITGEPFIWALGVGPILFVFLLLNLAWGGFILVRRRWSGGCHWLLAALVWFIAITIDFAHH
jgi:hypothetical protein